MNSSVLTLVRVVCREKPSVEALTHAVQLLQAFVAPRITFAAVLEKNSTLHLLKLAIQQVEQSASISYEKCRQFRLAMQLVPGKISVENGALEAMKELYSRYPNAVDNQALKAIIAMGDFSVLQWLYACERKTFEKNIRNIFAVVSLKGVDKAVRWVVKLFPTMEFDLSFAVKGGHVEQLEWLLENARFNPLNVPRAVRAAIKRGDLEMAQFLHGLTLEFYVVSIETLAERGHRTMLKWVYETFEVESWAPVPKEAASSGRLEILQWLHNTEIEVYWGGCMDVAAGNGHLEVVKWLDANRNQGCSVLAMNSAAANGHLEVVKWLHENRTEGCSPNVMSQAARNGHVHVLEWMHANRHENFNSSTANCAAAENQFEALKWLVEHGTKGNIDVVAGTGNLETVKWLHARGGATCTKQAMDHAAAGGYLDILKFLHENRQEGCTRKAMNDAACHGHFEVVKWLCRNYWKNCKMKAVTLAATNGHLGIVMYLIERRSGGHPDSAMVGAAANGHFQVMEFLGSKFSSEWPHEAMKKAVSGGHVEAVRCLFCQANQPLYPSCGVDATRAGNVDLMEFIRVNSEYCNSNPNIFFLAGGACNIEISQWYRDYFGSPRKRQRGDTK